MTCSRCGWSGNKHNCSKDTYSDGVYVYTVYSCPDCGMPLDTDKERRR